MRGQEGGIQPPRPKLSHGTGWQRASCLGEQRGLGVSAGWRPDPSGGGQDRLGLSDHSEGRARGSEDLGGSRGWRACVCVCWDSCSLYVVSLLKHWLTLANHLQVNLGSARCGEGSQCRASVPGSSGGVGFWLEGRAGSELGSSASRGCAVSSKGGKARNVPRVCVVERPPPPHPTPPPPRLSPSPCLLHAPVWPNPAQSRRLPWVESGLGNSTPGRALWAPAGPSTVPLPRVTDRTGCCATHHLHPKLWSSFTFQAWPLSLLGSREVICIKHFNMYKSLDDAVISCHCMYCYEGKIGTFSEKQKWSLPPINSE